MLSPAFLHIYVLKVLGRLQLTHVPVERKDDQAEHQLVANTGAQEFRGTVLAKGAVLQHMRRSAEPEPEPTATNCTGGAALQHGAAEMQGMGLKEAVTQAFFVR